MTYSILFLGSQMAIGGAQQVLLQQAEWFHKQGYRVTAAFLYDKEGLEEGWKKTYNIPLVNLQASRNGAGKIEKSRLLLGGLWRTWKLMRRGKFDAIETFTHHSNFFLVLAWLAGIPIRLATHHGRILGFPRWLERMHAWVINLGFASYFAVVSQRVGKAAIEEGVHPDKIRVVHNGIQIQRPIDFDRTALREQIGVTEDSDLVIAVGRLTEQKGHTYLVQAVPHVLKHFPNTQFAIAGDGDLRDALQAKISAGGLEKHIHLLGSRQDVPQLLACANLFVMPSISEGLPLALLEAMGQGLACVATHIVGIEEVITQEESGLLVPPADSVKLADALCELLRDREKREKIAMIGQKHVLDGYSLDVMCRKYQELLDPKKIASPE